jgi:hypothetical protein
LFNHRADLQGQRFFFCPVAVRAPCRQLDSGPEPIANQRRNDAAVHPPPIA